MRLCYGHRKLKSSDYIDSCKSLHITDDYQRTYILLPSNNSLGSILLQLFHVRRQTFCKLCKNKIADN